MNQVKERMGHQFSLDALWGRVARVLIVGTTWITATGVPETPETWAGLIGAMLGASYTHRPKQ